MECLLSTGPTPPSFLTICGALNRQEEEEDLIILSITTMFVEQTLALPGSTKNQVIEKS